MSSGVPHIPGVARDAEGNVDFSGFTNSLDFLAAAGWDPFELQGGTDDDALYHLVRMFPDAAAPAGKRSKWMNRIPSSRSLSANRLTGTSSPSTPSRSSSSTCRPGRHPLFLPPLVPQEETGRVRQWRRTPCSICGQIPETLLDREVAMVVISQAPTPYPPAQKPT